MSCFAVEPEGEIEHAEIEHANDILCVLGLGTVGLPLVSAFAACGLRVIGVDNNTQVVDDLNNQRLRRSDPQLESAISAPHRRLRFAATLPPPGTARTYLLAVGTPVDPNHRFDSAQLDAAMSALMPRLRPGNLVILRSTVPIGTTRALSDRVAARVDDVDFACCPDRSVTGDTFREIHRLPQIVGGTTPRAQARAGELFARLGVEIVAVDDVETAEAVKLIGNVQRDVLFALSNEIAMICDRSGLDAHHVIESSRRGYPRHILPPPGPVGGPCLTKDVFLYAEGLPQGTRPHLALNARAVNAGVAAHVAAFISQQVATVSAPIVAVLGIAFKGRPETAVADASWAGELRAELGALLPRAIFRGWDPVARPHAAAALGFQPCETAAAAVADAHVVVLANDHPDIAGLPLPALARALARPALIYDLWGSARGSTGALPEGVMFRIFGGHRRNERSAAKPAPT